MNKQVFLQIVWLVNTLLLCCCAPAQKQVEQKASPSESNRPKQKQKLSGAELKQLYESARSEYERAARKSEHEQRAVCLRAIDEGTIYRGMHVSAIDEIFGTNFASRLPTEREGMASGHVLFAPQFYSLPKPGIGVVEAVDYYGWVMRLQYDRQGNLQDYRLSNVHKGTGITAPEGKERALIVELKRLYKAATSEFERRAVCLRAIDEGIIHHYGSVSAIDEIFGTRFASNLSTGKAFLRTDTIDFVRNEPRTDESKAAANTGWFMAVEYDERGVINDYYLTNLHK